MASSHPLRVDPASSHHPFLSLQSLWNDGAGKRKWSRPQSLGSTEVHWGHLSGQVTPGIHIPDPHPTLALTHFLLLRAGCSPSPGAQRQSLSRRLGGRTPRFLAPPHAHAPVSLVTQKGGGSCLPSLPPSWEREGEKVWSMLGGARQAGVVMKLVSLPRCG